MQTGPLQTLTRRLEDAKLPALVRRPLLNAWTLVQDLLRLDLTKQASAMAYVTLLSLIPSLVAIFCVLSLFSPLLGKDGSLVEQLRDFILSNLAPDSGGAAVDYLDQMLGNLNLSTIGISSFASVLVTLVLLLRQIEEALNRIWLVRKGRNPITRFMYFWTFLTFGAVVVGVVVGFATRGSLKKMFAAQGELVVATQGQGIVGSLIGWTGSFLFFLFLYKIVPNCRVMTRNAAIGAAVSAVCLSVASRIYTAFVIGSASYKTLYGALAQLPIFLMWLYVCWVIILLGALVSWRLQEGFPLDEKEESLDTAQSPVEQLRNVQVKATLPLVALLAIHRKFTDGSGIGLCAQELAHALKLPLTWIAEAIDALESFGYVVQAKPKDGDVEEVASATDPYFPTASAATLKIERITTDLGRPLSDWMAGWTHDLPLDIPAALQLFRDLELGKTKARTLAEALKMIPA